MTRSVEHTKVSLENDVLDLRLHNLGTDSQKILIQSRDSFHT